MSKETPFSEKLYQHYREYIQFLNDLDISTGLATILLIFPSFTILTDLLPKYPGQNIFQKFSYLGGSEILISAIETDGIAGYIVSGISFFLLIIPLFILLMIVIKTALRDEIPIQQGQYRKNYENFLIHKMVRFYFLAFSFVFFPIFISLGIKLQNFTDQIFLQLVGIVIIITSFLNEFFIEYYSLQLKTKNINTSKKINFPNSLFDKIILLAIIIVVNQTEGIIPFAATISTYFLRFLVTIYFPFYEGHIYENHKFQLVVCGSLAIGLLLAYISGEHLILMIMATFVIFLLLRMKKIFFSAGKKDEYEMIKDKSESESEEEENIVEELKKNLWDEGRFTHVFRQLLFNSRKNNSHRQKLCLDILKSKCYRLENQSRGGAKVVNALDVLEYESLITEVITNTLLIADKSITILNLIQKKQPKIEEFIKEIIDLVELIDTSKLKIEKCTRINCQAMQGKYLLKMMCEELHNDFQFVKEIEQRNRENIISTHQKMYRDKIFNPKTAVVFINALDQVGKITKVSSNLTDVLGYSSHHLVGLSINEIIPNSIKKLHDQVLLNFLKGFKIKHSKKDPYIQFYAYNKEFNLQQAKISYNFIMNYFEDFQLSGVMQRIDSDEAIILTDYYGNLEGWTSKVCEILPMNEIIGSDCQLFNILPLIPALPKYMNGGGICIQTLLFKVSQIKNQNLILMDLKKEAEESEIWKRQLKAFREVLRSEQVVEIYLVHVQLELLQFYGNRIQMRKIVLKNHRRIQNMDRIIENLQSMESQLNQLEEGRNYLEENGCNGERQCQQSIQCSIIADEIRDQVPPDFNFTLNFGFTQEKRLTMADIYLAKSNSRTSFITVQEIPAQTENESAMEEQIMFFEKSSHQSSFNPKIEKRSHYIWVIIILTVVFLALLIYDIIYIHEAKNKMLVECQKVKKRNRALMIFSKSVFNPNETYISQFDDGRLLEFSKRLYQESFRFRTWHGQYIPENRFYMFNVQVPSTLDRIVNAKTTKIRSQFYRQIEYNFYKIVQAYDDHLQKSSDEWKATINETIKWSVVKIGVVAFGSIIYVLFLVYINLESSKQRKMMQAFFKFEKIDLEKKIVVINKVVDQLEAKVTDWHLEKFYFDFIKNYEFTNLKLNNQFNPKASMVDNEKTNKKKNQPSDSEEKGKKNVSFFVGVIILFLITQVLFLVIYSVLATTLLENFKQIPLKIDDACKLTVYPNLQLSTLFISAPTDIISSYRQITNQILETPTDLLPKLFPLLQEPPCSSCLFWPSVLSTNFRSFYSTFNEVIEEKRSLGDTNVNETFYSVDVVSQKIMSALQISEQPILPLTLLLYVFSLTVFYVLLWIELKKMTSENGKLQVFLKYFNQETVQKNKHMSALLTKNI